MKSDGQRSQVNNGLEEYDTSYFHPTDRSQDPVDSKMHRILRHAGGHIRVVAPWD
jgi:hypothetical protein